MTEHAKRGMSTIAAAARRESIAHVLMKPRPGALVVETTGFRAVRDPDSVGYLLGHGDAPYREDGTGPTREVWDVVPLTLARGRKKLPYQRWENAEFRVTMLPIPLRYRLRARIRFWLVRRKYA